MSLTKMILVRKHDGRDLWVNAARLEYVQEVNAKLDGVPGVQKATLLTFASGRSLTVSTPAEQVLAQVQRTAREAA